MGENIEGFVRKDRALAEQKIAAKVIKEWETIGISNDFVFCKVMQDGELLEGLIQLILPDLQFKEIIIQAQ